MLWKFFFDQHSIPSCRWYYNYQTGYISNEDGVYLHQFVASTMNSDLPLEVGHINRIKIDNRRINLHTISHVLNMQNTKIYKNNASGVKGVCFNKREGRYIAYINFDSKRAHLGTFDNITDAINARRNGEIKYWHK